MAEPRPEIQFATLGQQTETAQLGMWVFLATEVLFFGALFFSYYIYRISYPDQFVLAGKDSKLLLGSVNVAILVTSSLTMVSAIEFIKRDFVGRAFVALLITAALGFAYLGVKGFEYVQDYKDHTVLTLDFVLKSGEHPPAKLYWVFYFIGTAVHALHVSIGVIAILVMAQHTRAGRYSRAYYSPIEVLGLYWSFVDTVWFFLFAAIYPIGRAG